MKVQQVLFLAGTAAAFPTPQFPSLPSLPSLPSMPSFPSFGSGSGTGTGTGSGFTLPSLPSGGGAGGSGLGGLLGGLRPGGTTAAAPAPVGTGTATATGGAPAPPASTGGAGSIGANCQAQSTNGGTTENGVTDKSCCTDMTVIFARGTGEGGNMGFVAGPPMVKAIRSKLGADRVTVQGVDYAASAAGNAAMGGDGGKVMASLVTQALSQCPDTKIILSGYSQGGMVVHNAFTQGVSASQVSGAVLFGDPFKTQAVGDLPASSVKQFCGTSDFICGGGGDGGATGSHISYGSSAEAAATFAIQAAGLA